MSWARLLKRVFDIGIAPELGEHNEAVLAALGYSAAEIAGFRDRKVI